MKSPSTKSLPFFLDLACGQRLTLYNAAPWGKGDTAKALHAYYSSHTSPQLHSFETLSKVTGLREKQKRDVRARLIKAHEELRNIGFLTDFEVTNSGIKIKKINTSSQQKHLVKAFSKPERKRPQKGTG